MSEFPEQWLGAINHIARKVGVPSSIIINGFLAHVNERRLLPGHFEPDLGRDYYDNWNLRDPHATFSLSIYYDPAMPTHIRKIVRHVREDGWVPDPNVTDGHFVPLVITEASIRHRDHYMGYKGKDKDCPIELKTTKCYWGSTVLVPCCDHWIDGVLVGAEYFNSLLTYEETGLKVVQDKMMKRGGCRS